MAEEKPKTILQRENAKGFLVEAFEEVKGYLVEALEGVAEDPRLTLEGSKKWLRDLPQWVKGFGRLSAIALFVGLAATFLFYVLSTLSQVAGLLDDAKENSEALRNLSFLLAAVVGFPFLVWRAWVAERQAVTAEDNSITNSFSRAIEQLGATREVEAEGDTVRKEHEPNIEVRLGALYTLERLMKASAKDHPAITDIIAAYIRENAPPLPRHDKPTEESEKDAPARPRVDIQTALTIIGRNATPGRQVDLRRADLGRAELQGANFDGALLLEANLRGANLEGAFLQGASLQGAFLQRVNLRGASLEGAKLWGAKLMEANLWGTNLKWAFLQRAKLMGAKLMGAKLMGADLEGANLEGANLEGAYLVEANLERANLERANLEGANLGWANLERANLEGAYLVEANLVEANLGGANLEGANLEGADLRGAVGLTQEQVDSALGDDETILPEGLTRPDHWTKK